MRMPFGKFKGEHLEDIDDTSYLTWLEQQDWLKPELRAAVQHEIDRRTGDVTSAGRVVKKGK